MNSCMGGGDGGVTDEGAAGVPPAPPPEGGDWPVVDGLSSAMAVQPLFVRSSGTSPFANSCIGGGGGGLAGVDVAGVTGIAPPDVPLSLLLIVRFLQFVGRSLLVGTYPPAFSDDLHRGRRGDAGDLPALFVRLLGRVML
jgi:hypothetical protein